MIYYVEDDTNIRDLTVYALKQAGFEAAGFAAAGEFFVACKRRLPELVLLDIMLPEVDGLEILHMLREDPATKHLPVMMLTAKGTEFDTVSGLDAGADDYLAKPFRHDGAGEPRERAHASRRRAGRGGRRRVLVRPHCAHGVVARPSPWTARTLRSRSRSSTFCARSCRTRGMCCRVSQLLEDVWGMTYVGETRTVDVHIQTLRQKLAAAVDGCRRPTSRRCAAWATASSSHELPACGAFPGGAARDGAPMSPTHLRVKSLSGKIFYGRSRRSRWASSWRSRRSSRPLSTICQLRARRRSRALTDQRSGRRSLSQRNAERRERPVAVGPVRGDWRATRSSLRTARVLFDSASADASAAMENHAGAAPRCAKRLMTGMAAAVRYSETLGHRHPLCRRQARRRQRRSAWPRRGTPCWLSPADDARPPSLVALDRWSYVLVFVLSQGCSRAVS